MLFIGVSVYSNKRQLLSAYAENVRNNVITIWIWISLLSSTLYYWIWWAHPLVHHRCYELEVHWTPKEERRITRLWRLFLRIHCRIYKR